MKTKFHSIWGLGQNLSQNCAEFDSKWRHISIRVSSMKKELPKRLGNFRPSDSSVRQTDSMHLMYEQTCHVNDYVGQQTASEIEM